MSVHLLLSQLAQKLITITCSHFTVHYIYTPVWWPQIISKLLWLFVFFFNLLIQSCSHKHSTCPERRETYVPMRKEHKKFLAISIINKITFTDTNVFPGWLEEVAYFIWQIDIVRKSGQVVSCKKPFCGSEIELPSTCHL